MREYQDRTRWQQVKGKRQAHWGILTLDDLPKRKGEYSQLIARLKARYKTTRIPGSKPAQKTEDFSI